MKVELKDEENKDTVIETPKETDSLPEPVEGETQSPVDKPEVVSETGGRERELELENAELRGRANALQEVTSSSGKNSNAANEEWKATVLRDVNGMQDEDFRNKYRCEKYQATSAILEHEFKSSSSQQKQQIAELKAENRMSMKFGRDFFDRKKEVDEVVAMASQEVKQDPDKLSKLMERAYMAASKDKPAKQPIPGQVKQGGDVRRIVSSFEKPSSSKDSVSKKEPESDSLPENYRKLGKAFNLTSEKERKELLSTEFVPMELGGGLIFRDPARGVEKTGS